jgi:hypothetical protein
MNENKRRYRMLLLGEDALLAILRGRITVEQFDVPDDAHVAAVHWDYARLGWAVVIESECFDPVPLGAVIPLLPPFALRQKD